MTGNEIDPTLSVKMVMVAQSVLDHAPNPVPAGQAAERYFNANYETLWPSLAYPWFQAQMIETSGKMPKPTLSARLLLVPEPGYRVVMVSTEGAGHISPLWQCAFWFRCVHQMLWRNQVSFGQGRLIRRPPG